MERKGGRASSLHRTWILEKGSRQNPGPLSFQQVTSAVARAPQRYAAQSEHIDGKATGSLAVSRPRTFAAAANNPSNCGRVQKLSPHGVELYRECLAKDKVTPGLRMWFDKRKGDYFYLSAFWVGSDERTGVGHYDEAPAVDNVDVVQQPPDFPKATPQPIVFDARMRILIAV